jgi:hypothetical protein
MSPRNEFDNDERDERWVTMYDDEAIELMPGWTGGQNDPLYAISSSGGANYAWVFRDAIANLSSDIAKVKKLGKNKYQLGKGTFTKKEIDELNLIHDALMDTLNNPDSYAAPESVSEGRRATESRRTQKVRQVGRRPVVRARGVVPVLNARSHTTVPDRADLIAALGLEPEGRTRMGKYAATTGEFWKRVQTDMDPAARQARRTLGLPEPKNPTTRHGRSD